MKYWSKSDIEHIDYVEGARVLPYKHPAAISTSDDCRIEVELIPCSLCKRKYVDPNTFTMEEGTCVSVERRIWRNGNDMHCEIFWVPLKSFGYTEEPENYASFELAMEIL